MPDTVLNILSELTHLTLGGRHRKVTQLGNGRANKYWVVGSVPLDHFSISNEWGGGGMNECLSYIWEEEDFGFYVFWLFIIFSLISLAICSFYSFILLLVSQLTQALCWGMKAPFCPLGDPI